MSCTSSTIIFYYSIIILYIINFLLRSPLRPRPLCRCFRNSFTFGLTSSSRSSSPRCFFYTNSLYFSSKPVFSWVNHDSPCVLCPARPAVLRRLLSDKRRWGKKRFVKWRRCVYIWSKAFERQLLYQSLSVPLRHKWVKISLSPPFLQAHNVKLSLCG